MVTPIDTKRRIDPERLGKGHDVPATRVGPTCQMGELDGFIGPSRPFGELDGVVDPTRPFGELECSSDSEIHFS
ncbi:hypothetical protein F2Q70_00002659 [Brassica cretica]|uniref:Uncharacterized protein n=1 Tax=Brassica cretica TaxID=69181 RepID=A0A8S9J011_BRACR|nr:hypothetical protein F2Q70_00002659 [Brassica cretica]